MPVSRSLIRTFIGGFVIYIGFDLALDVYRDGGNPLFYIASALFIIIGAGISLYYFKQHKKEMEEGIEEDEEAEESAEVSKIEDSGTKKESQGGFLGGLFGAKDSGETESKVSMSDIARMNLAGEDSESNDSENDNENQDE